jgi:hypothetical protein
METMIKRLAHIPYVVHFTVIDDSCVELEYRYDIVNGKLKMYPVMKRYNQGHWRIQRVSKAKRRGGK